MKQMTFLTAMRDYFGMKANLATVGYEITSAS